VGDKTVKLIEGNYVFKVWLSCRSFSIEEKYLKQNIPQY